MTIKKTDNTSLLALANVEALAGGEVTFPYYCVNIYYSVCAEELNEDGERFFIYGVRVNNPN